MHILTHATIKQYLDPQAVIEAIERGFIAYHQGKVTVPPVGHLALPGGDCHIKYGYKDGDDYFVIKIATGFHGNAARQLPSGNGMMMVFDAHTGFPVALLQDEGYLTDIRTAAAGLVAARALAPKHMMRIGILGAGVQARLQLLYLKHAFPCREVVVWNRSNAKADQFAKEMQDHGFEVSVVDNPRTLAELCQLIVTTTPSTKPLLRSGWVWPGTHITAMGADTPGKCELDPALVASADVKVVDALYQCIDHGEVQHAIKQGLVTQDQMVPLGAVLENPQLGRTKAEQITLADLTGVAIQDLEIAGSVYRAWLTDHG